MKVKKSIIVGGSGQLGICTSKFLLKKNQIVIITTRNISNAQKKMCIKNKNLIFYKLNILNKKDIENLIKKFEPTYIFYYAGQSSPFQSFKQKKITQLSNEKGCENFLKILKNLKSKTKFINASSSEIFGKTIKKISINSRKKPISPYGHAKLNSFNKTKFFRKKFKIKAYNAIFFNTESYYRNKSFLIPKICLAAINAYKYQKKTFFGNLEIVREWNWGDEQVVYLMKFLNKTPQDFILSNGKHYSAKTMLRYAFKYFNLNYKLYVRINKKFLRKKDFDNRKSKFKYCLKRNNLKRVSKIYGKYLIYKLIKFYLNENK